MSGTAVPGRRVRNTRHRTGGAFTLVELIVVITIISILVSLSLSAVQQTREAARRMTCQNRLRQQVLALHLHHDVHRRFPFGDEALSRTHHSWVTASLPFLEQVALSQQIDRMQPWNAAINLPAVRQSLTVMRCPSSILDFEGDTDYAGIMGSALASEIATAGLNLSNGVLVPSRNNRPRPIAMADVLDGTSNTICIGEVSDRSEELHGMWANGRNCISHDNGQVNVSDGGEIFSHHPGGAQVGLSDGAVRFLSKSISPQLIGGLCSRAGYEDVSEIWSY